MFMKCYKRLYSCVHHGFELEENTINKGIGLKSFQKDLYWKYKLNLVLVSLQGIWYLNFSIIHVCFSCASKERIKSKETAKKYFNAVIEMLKEVKVFETIDVKDLIFLQEKNKELAKQLGVEIKE